MKSLIRIYPVMFCLCAWFTTYAQGAAGPFPGQQGLDPLLYNGRFYTYKYPTKTKGTPFFNGPEFVQGNVTLRGTVFRDIRLKYDVVNQQLVMEYANANGGKTHIVISDAWLQSFDLEGTRFEFVALEDSTRHIYQTLGTGPYKIAYAWKKELKLDPRMGSSTFIFTKPVRTSFLWHNDFVGEFHHNKSFTALFSKSNQPVVRRYLQQQHIKIKKADEVTMTEIIAFCNSQMTL